MENVKNMLIQFSQTDDFAYIFIYFTLCLMWQIAAFFLIRWQFLIATYFSLFLRYCIFGFLLYLGVSKEMILYPIIGYIMVASLHWENLLQYRRKWISKCTS